MSRPLKTGLDYFPHDTDASDDDKIQSLMALFGCEGYSFYFILLERIYRSENGVLPLGKPIEKAGITRRLCMNIDRFDEILNASLEVGCFDRVEYDTNKCLTSDGIRKRIERIKVLREKERFKKENIKDKYKRKAKQGKTQGKPTENPKDIEIKHKYGEFKNVFLTDLEYQKLKDKFNSSAETWIKTMDEGIEYKGYKYKSHYLAILKWAEKESQGKKYL